MMLPPWGRKAAAAAVTTMVLITTTGTVIQVRSLGTATATIRAIVRSMNTARATTTR